MKKLTSVLLSLVMLMSVLCASALAAEQTDCLQATASLDAANNTVTVVFTAGEDTTNGKFTVEFDPAHLIFTDAEIAGIITSAENTDSSVTVSYATTTAGAIKAGEVVATVLFSISFSENAPSTELSVTVHEFNAEERLNAALPTITTGLPYVKYGDVNGDDRVNTRDVIIILQAIAAKETGDFTAEQFKLADADHDGTIGTRDAILILGAIASKTPLK